MIVVSSLTQRNNKLALEAIACGALEVIAKPSASYSVGDMCLQLADKIRAVARVRVAARKAGGPPETPLPKAAFGARTLTATTNKIIAIGASTGGAEALRRVLTCFPPNSPGILVVQHMPAQFTTSFAQRGPLLCAGQTRAPGPSPAAVGGQSVADYWKRPGGFQPRPSGSISNRDMAAGPVISG